MKQSEFNGIVVEMLTQAESTLTRKGREYAEAASTENEVDRLEHFKKAATLQGVTTAQAAFGMLAKHLVSVADMVASRETYCSETWDEKIGDSINYLLILRAIVQEAAV